MEVRKGYKETDVGIIPDDWEVDYVKNLAVIKTGSKNTQDRIENGIYPFFVRSQTVERINTYSYDGEAVLTAGDGVGVGKVIHYVNGKFDCHQRVYRISDFHSRLNGYYFYLYFANNFLNRIMQMTAKSSVDSVRMDMIADMAIPIPPTIREQTAIATALSDADALITSLKKLIAKKHDIKQGAMQELFKPKKGWKVKKLGNVASLKARIGWQGLTTSEYRNSGDYFLITGTEFKNGFIDWDKCFYVDEERFIQDKNIQVKEHDVLVTKDGTIGKIALIKSLPKAATLNSGVFVIRPINESFDPEFFYYLLLSEVFFTFLAQLTAGSTINHLYQKDFVTFNFSTPETLKEQRDIAQILTDMDDELMMLEAKLEKYKQIKSGMMQNLLTGKIRLI
jgi:type I restriction enzyme, S subunit